jgi:hypothetical protein
MCGCLLTRKDFERLTRPDRPVAPRRDGGEDRRAEDVPVASRDDEGEVLEMLVQTRRTKRAARKLLKNQRIRPETIVTDGLTSYGAATSELGCADRHRPGRLRENNRAENSHLPIRRRERKQQGFKSRGSARTFLTTHAAVYNTFNVLHHLTRRPTLRQLRAEAEGPRRRGRQRPRPHDRLADGRLFTAATGLPDMPIARPVHIGLLCYTQVDRPLRMKQCIDWLVQEHGVGRLHRCPAST